MTAGLSAEQRDKLNAFLGYAKNDRDPSCLIVEDQELLACTRNELARKGVTVTGNWQQAMKCLESYQPCALELSSPIDRHHYDLVTQYHRRGGMIQIMDRSTLTLRTVQFVPRRSNLFLLVSRSDLKKIEEQYPVMSEVGITERM